MDAVQKLARTAQVVRVCVCVGGRGVVRSLRSLDQGGSTSKLWIVDGRIILIVGQMFSFSYWQRLLGSPTISSVLCVLSARVFDPEPGCKIKLL